MGSQIHCPEKVRDNDAEGLKGRAYGHSHLVDVSRAEVRSDASFMVQLILRDFARLDPLLFHVGIAAGIANSDQRKTSHDIQPLQSRSGTSAMVKTTLRAACWLGVAG